MSNPEDTCNYWKVVGENTCGETKWCPICGAIKYVDFGEYNRTPKEHYEWAKINRIGCSEREALKNV